MNLIELTNNTDEKLIVNFNYVIQFNGNEKGSIINMNGDNSPLRFLFVKETPAQIEKMLNETGHRIKRLYAPHDIFVPAKSDITEFYP